MVLGGGVRALRERALAAERSRIDQILLLIRQCVNGVRVLVARALAATHSLRSRPAVNAVSLRAHLRAGRLRARGGKFQV